MTRLINAVPVARHWLVGLLLVALIPLSVVYAPVYWLLLGLSRLILITYSARLAVVMLHGQAARPLGFLAGVGGLLYVTGLVALWCNMGKLNGADLSFLLRVVGTALLVAPMTLKHLPLKARRVLGLECE